MESVKEVIAYLKGRLNELEKMDNYDSQVSSYVVRSILKDIDPNNKNEY